MKIICLLFSLFLVQVAIAQNPHTARLKQELLQAKNDTAKVLIMSDISTSYRLSKPDSALLYGKKGLKLARRIAYLKGEGRCLARVAFVSAESGNTPEAFKYFLEALHLNDKSQDWEGKVQTLNMIGLMFHTIANYDEARKYLFQAKKMYEDKKLTDDTNIITSLTNIGFTYLSENRLDSARVYLFQTYELVKNSKDIHQSIRGNPSPYVVREIGNLYEHSGNNEEALRYYRQSIIEGQVENDLRSLCVSYQLMSNWFKKNNQPDSSIVYARKALLTAKSLPFMQGILRAAVSLNDIYRIKGNKDSVLKYMSLTIAANNSLFNPERMRKIQMISLAEQQRLQQMQEQQERFNNRLKIYGLLGGVAILVFIAFLLWRNIRQQKIANALVQQEKEKVESTLQELKVTQTQLIQSEKMASLGELTAGIAHEIQNPLNFVNNFSEVSMELIEEVKSEKLKAKSERSEELENELLDDISQNLQKISHHGKRADFIVKGMLQHSRTSTGEKQLTNLNTLADEFLKLSYHGHRAKDKSFNAELVTNFDPDLPKVNIVQQDIGRVLLNLFNNAFYAVQEKRKAESPKQNEEYKPVVEVSTLVKDGFVVISVRDNGNGIPEGIKDKIMQPFFTTKPTGEGTGLGLSLSYDIIKAHCGEIKVETLPADRHGKEGEGAAFIIQLPV
ncbi:MAG: ATP-binding protein [Daejeonella sp.]|nr:ATP-binding protein [Daejeonella sp.]